MKLLSNPRFLAIYSGLLTVTFLFTVLFSVSHGVSLRSVAAQSTEAQSAAFDQITVHRINVVESDGTPRLVIAGKAEFPGAYFKGKELRRSDRIGYAGMLFLDDEGSEEGGLVFGGHRSSDGTMHSFGHLSFDEYESNQALALDMSQQGDDLLTSYLINDNDVGLRTQEVQAELEKARRMPDGPEKQKQLTALVTKDHLRLVPRAGLTREGDKSVALRLRDPEGNTRLLLRVAANGTPSMEFLDATGKVTQQWSAANVQGRDRR